VDHVHGVGSSNPLGVLLCWMRAYSLAQASYLIFIRPVPCRFVIGVAAKLPLLKELASLVVEY